MISLEAPFYFGFGIFYTLARHTFCFSTSFSILICSIFSVFSIFSLHPEIKLFCTSVQVIEVIRFWNNQCKCKRQTPNLVKSLLALQPSNHLNVNYTYSINFLYVAGQDAFGTVAILLVYSIFYVSLFHFCPLTT